MTTGSGSGRRLVVFLTEDRYAQPLVKLATELIAGPLGAAIRHETVDQSLLLSEGKLRAKIWDVHEKARERGHELLRIDGFVDTEGKPKTLPRALEVEKAINDPTGHQKPPCLVRLHVLKPNQEGFLLHAPKVLVEASERTMAGGFDPTSLESVARKAQKSILVPGKRPKTKQKIMVTFWRLFGHKGKSIYMRAIAETSQFSAEAFESAPSCMSPSALGLPGDP